MQQAQFIAGKEPAMVHLPWFTCIQAHIVAKKNLSMTLSHVSAQGQTQRDCGQVLGELCKKYILCFYLKYF